MTSDALTVPRGHYRIRNVARAEMVKIVTLRSTAVTLGLTAVACLLVTGLVTHNAAHQNAGYYQFGYDPTQDSLTGMITVALAGGVFGALLITSEYSSGTIRSTLAAAPNRALLLTAKLAITATLIAAVCEILSVASFLLGEAILSGGGAPSAGLGSPGAARAVLCTGVFVALLALMSFGLGLVFRSTAAAIAAFVGVIFVLPLVMHGISESGVRYLPTNILTNSIMATVHQAGQSGRFAPLSSVVGLLLMAVYAGIALAVGSALFFRRDT